MRVSLVHVHVKAEYIQLIIWPSEKPGPSGWPNLGSVCPIVACFQRIN